jgi:MoaA/NifB/PqqE/SkfB family radical SAM enzyme
MSSLPQPDSTPPAGVLRRGRLHVAMGPDCNNNCLFCMEEDRASRRLTNGALTGPDVRAILEQGRGAQEVCFTSGEPTLVPELAAYVRWARELGYPRVSITTNGRRLCYPGYCDQLLEAGADRFYLSVHGHTHELHDRLTRTPGAFTQSVAAIRNLVTRSADLHTCTVVTKQNLSHLSEIYRFLRGLGATQVIFNVLQPHGRAETHFDLVVPRYREVVAAFLQVLQDAGEPQPPTFLVDLPACAAQPIPAVHRGWVEAYVHHEVEAESTSAADRLIERSRAEFDRDRREKAASCAFCRADPHCPGVWRSYLARYGWTDLLPIERGPT